MIILRVENTSGDGAYTSNGRGAGYAHNKAACPINDRHPGPWNDSKLYAQFQDILYNRHSAMSLRDALFGFATVDQYFNWFYTFKIRQVLDNIGFSLSFYYVPDQFVVIGDAQCVFNKRRADFVTRLPCTQDREKLIETAREAFLGQLDAAA